MLDCTIRFTAVAAVLPFLACFDAVKAPACGTISDCPPSGRYVSCEDGLCFRSGRCDSAKPVPGDACCASTESDRTADTDCLVLDLDLKIPNLTAPALDPTGNVYLTGVRFDSGAASVYLTRVPPRGSPVSQVRVGSGSSAVPAIVSRGTSVYAAGADGVVRYAVADLAVEDVLALGGPVGGLVSTDGMPGAVVAWISSTGDLVTYSEDSKKASVVQLGTAAPKTGGFAPVLSGTGTRMFFAAASGLLLGFDLTASLSSALAVYTLPSPPATGPVESYGALFVVTQADGLLALRPEGQEFHLAWTLPLTGGDTVAGSLLVGVEGRVVIPLRSGRVRVVQDRGDTGSVVGEGDFGKTLGNFGLVAGLAGRIAAVAADGRTILTLIRTDSVSAVTFTKGLQFGTALPVGASPTLVAGRFLFPTPSGHLLSYVYPDDLSPNGFAKAASDAGNTGRTRLLK
jgi:hypothetical protein